MCYDTKNITITKLPTISPANIKVEINDSCFFGVTLGYQIPKIGEEVILKVET